MKNLLQVLFFILLLIKICFAQGSLIDTSFVSNSLNINRNLQVYLPEGYNPQDSTRYPVAFYLHGATGDYKDDPELKGTLDDLIKSNSISPLIVVKPDGSIGPWGGSFYTNSELYGNFENYIVYDLVEFIDSTYKTIRESDRRVIWGASMGGYGAMKLALKHPDIYCGVASHSGPQDFSHFKDWIPRILSENGGIPVSDYIPIWDNQFTHLFTYLFYTAAGAFSPNLNNSPYQVDFPLDSMGIFIDSTLEKWLSHNPVRLAANLPSNSDLAIYFDCGTQDEFLLYSFNTDFAAALDSLGLKYVFHPFVGTHTGQLPSRWTLALRFIDSVMNKTTGVYNKQNNSIISFKLDQNYPNPFNPSTKIQYSLPQSSKVVIKVFDILGSEIEILVNEEKSAGTYELNWNASKLSSGVYFYQLKAGNYIQTKKMILMK